MSGYRYRDGGDKENINWGGGEQYTFCGFFCWKSEWIAEVSVQPGQSFTKGVFFFLFSLPFQNNDSDWDNNNLADKPLLPVAVTSG